MVVVDTSAWIEWLIDSPLAPRIAPHMERLGEIVVPTLVQYELYKWAVRERDEAAAVELIGLTAQAQVEPLDTQLAISAAELSAAFKLPMADAVVYASARARSATLLTTDAHFKHLPHVEYIEKASESAPR